MSKSPEYTEVIKKIDELPPDLKRELFELVQTIDLKNNTKKNIAKLATVSKNFHSKYSIIDRLETANHSKPDSELLKTYIDTIGDVKIRTILKTPNHVKVLKTDLNKIDYNTDFDNSITDADTLQEAKTNYNKEDFNEQKKDWENTWNKVYKNPDRLNFLQKKITLLKNSSINFQDTPKNRENIDKFLKLNDNNTYEDYLTAIKNLPLGSKASVGI